MKKDETLLNWSDTKHDRNGNGVDDTIEPPAIDIEASSHELRIRLKRHHNCDPSLAAGDVDAQWEDAESTGDEAACSSNVTPDQNVVEEIGAAVGITYQRDEELRLVDKERARDAHRWELDPASSDDYRERMFDGRKRHAPAIVRWFKRHWRGE